jgi:hypothetical protein
MLRILFLIDGYTRYSFDTTLLPISSHCNNIISRFNCHSVKSICVYICQVRAAVNEGPEPQYASDFSVEAINFYLLHLSLMRKYLDLGFCDILASMWSHLTIVSGGSLTTLSYSPSSTETIFFLIRISSRAIKASVRCVQEDFTFSRQVPSGLSAKSGFHNSLPITNQKAGQILKVELPTNLRRRQRQTKSDKSGLLFLYKCACE